MALSNPFQGPGDKDFLKMGIPNPQNPQAGSLPLNPLKTAPPQKHPPSKDKGGGGGRKAVKPKPKEAEPEPEAMDMTGPEQVAEKEKEAPKAVLTKIGWVKDKTLSRTDAEIFAEFEVPESVKDRTLVDFQLWENMDGEFIRSKHAEGYIDANGRATTTVPIDKGDKLEATFALKAKHCSQDDFDEPRADRVVTDTAEITFEHIQVSGLHFPKNSSFIGDEYLSVLCEVKKTYLDWKKTHDKAQVIVYGHAEADQDGEPHPLSKSRAKSAFLFLIGDVDGWAELAEKERWGCWEQQCMLRALGHFDKTVKPTGTRGPKTRTATEKFFAFLEKERGKKFNLMLGFSEAYIRKELYREYMNVKRSELELPSSAFRLVSGFPYVGCSAFNRYNAGAELHAENRRAVFVILKESPNFPMTFPCRSGTGPCEGECKKPGERAIQGFRCGFYDKMVREEKLPASRKSTEGDDVVLSEAHLKLISKASDALVAKYQPEMNRQMKAKGIDTPLKVAHFLAQVCAESMSLRYAEEIASGEAYEGRKDLGNTESGDGIKFKGRGLIQITGRENYSAFGTYCGEDFTTGENNLKVEEPKYAILSAIWYWSSRHLNEKAEEDAFLAVTFKVNGGFNGIRERAKFLKRGYEAFELEDSKSRLRAIFPPIKANLDKVLPLVSEAIKKNPELDHASAAKQLQKGKVISLYERLLFVAVDSDAAITSFKSELGI